MFHQHDFKRVSSTFGAPVPIDQRISGTPDLIKVLRFGMTTMTFLCPCGDLMKVESLGREERGVLDIKFSEVKR